MTFISMRVFLDWDVIKVKLSTHRYFFADTVLPLCVRERQINLPRSVGRWLPMDPLNEDLDRSGNEDRKDWSTSGEALTIVCKRSNLKNTITIALIVGTVLFTINQLDVVLRGEATRTVWLKIIITYFVPFMVSNIGILSVTRRKKNQERSKY